MKKSLLVLACLFAFTACSESNTATNSPPPAVASNASGGAAAPGGAPEKKAEHYIVGTDATYPPFDFKDDKGQVIGFDVDILKAIAEDQGFSVEFVSTKRSELFPTLSAGGYQILAACLGINPDRLANSEMSTPYAYAPNVIMGKDTGNNPQTLADLVSKKVAVQEGSYSEDSLKKAQVNQLTLEKTPFAAYTVFLRGEADFVVGDAGTLNYYHKGNTDANKPKVYTAVYDKTEDVRVAFAVQKGNTELAKKINDGLKNIEANGTYDKIYAQWFGDDNSLRVPK